MMNFPYHSTWSEESGIFLLLSASLTTLQVFDGLASDCLRREGEVLFLDRMTLIATLEFYPIFLLFLTFAENEIFFSLEFRFVDFSGLEKSLYDAVKSRLIHFPRGYKTFFEFSEREDFLLFEEGEDMTPMNGRDHKKTSQITRL